MRECERVTFEHRDENKNCSICQESVNERVKECECECERVTFEHRHENKSCSACQESVNERVKEKKFFKFLIRFLVPSFCLTFRHFLLRNIFWAEKTL